MSLYETKRLKTYSNVHNVPVFIKNSSRNAQSREWSFYLKEEQKIFWDLVIREERTYSNPYKCIQHINKIFSCNIRPHKSCLLSDSLLEMGTKMVYA